MLLTTGFKTKVVDFGLSVLSNGNEDLTDCAGVSFVKCKVMQIFVDKGSDTGVHVSGKRFAEFGFRDDTDNTKGNASWSCVWRSARLLVVWMHDLRALYAEVSFLPPLVRR